MILYWLIPPDSNFKTYLNSFNILIHEKEGFTAHHSSHFSHAIPLYGVVSCAIHEKITKRPGQSNLLQWTTRHVELGFIAVGI